MFDLIGRAYAQQRWPTLAQWNSWIIPTNTSLGEIINHIIDFILVIAGIIAVIYLIYGGILYITAGGDAEKATKGRTAVVNAIIGIVIILLAFVITFWVARAVNTGNTNPV